MKNKISGLIIIALTITVVQNCVATLPASQPSASPKASVSAGSSFQTPVPVSTSASGVTVVTPVAEFSPAAINTPQSTPAPSSTPQVIRAILQSTVAISTIAGNFVSDSANSDINVEFSHPQGITIDVFGNIFVADTRNNTIRRIDPAGKIIRVAGSGIDGLADDVASKAQFSAPSGIAADSRNNLYVTDTNNHRIRKISFDGNVTTFSGGEAGMIDSTLSQSRFNQPKGITVDPEGNFYISDNKSFTVRKINTYKVTTISGSGIAGSKDGAGSEAKFSSPQGITIDYSHNLYVADTENNVIRKISPEGNVSTFAGSAEASGFTDGTGTEARFNAPVGITYTPDGYLFVTDSLNNRIRRINQNGVVTTVTGSIAGYKDGGADKALFNQPAGITSDLKGNLFIADSENNRIRKITFN